MSTSTQLATYSPEPPRSPWIPPELISLILSKLWEEDLSSDERLTSLQNVVLVNRTWLILVAPIASDVHLFNEPNARKFFTSLRKQSPWNNIDLFSIEASLFINEICRSITLHVDGNLKASCSSLTKTTPAIWDLSQTDTAIIYIMYMVYMFEGWLPDLRYMSLRYTDWAYDDVFEQVTWGSVPRQVTHLSIDYSFSAPASEVRAFEAATILRLSGRIFRSRFPDIKRLSFSGMSTRLVATMLKLFPNVETLEIAHPVQLAALAPLPSTVRTLVLCYPGVAVSKDMLASGVLDTGLEVGLYAKGTKLRIIVRSGTPDHVACAGLRRNCEGFNAVLVYERDDFRRRGCIVNMSRTCIVSGFSSSRYR